MDRTRGVKSEYSTSEDKKKLYMGSLDVGAVEFGG